MLLAPERLSAAAIGPSEDRFLAAIERVNPALATAAGVKVALNGRGGKVGSVLAPALEAAGHELVESSDDADAVVDFTAPEAVEANVQGGARARRPVRRRDDGLGDVRGSPSSPWRRASRCSTPRTSRSAPC